MSFPLVTNLNYNQLQALNMVIQNLAAAPGTPVEGQVYHDTVAHKFMWHNGTTFIDSTARANHTGTQLAATISNLAATVQAYTLDQFAAPAANVSMNSHKLTNLLDPTSPQDAATMNFVTNTLQGFSSKGSAAASTIAALPANTYVNGAGTLTGTSVGVLTVDGYATALNDIILVQNEAAPAHNGLYQVTVAGAAGTAYVLTRATNMATSTEFTGAYIVIDETSATLGGAIFICNAVAPTVGTTSITFTRINPVVSYSADGNVTTTLTGTTFSVSASYIGQASITTVGTLAAGIWNATTIAVAHGGTGQTTALTPGAVIFGSTATAMGQTAAGTSGQLLASGGAATPTWITAVPIANGGTGQITAAAALAALGGTTKYSTLIGDGSSTTITITHNLNTKTVLVQVYDIATGSTQYPDIARATVNTVTATFAVAPASNAYEAVVIG